jgi:hypothetical protein
MASRRFAPIFRRGVLLDIAKTQETSKRSPPAEEVTVADLETRTRKMRECRDPSRRRDPAPHRLDTDIGQIRDTYLGLDSARVRPASRRAARSGSPPGKPFAVGNDTAGFEQIVQTDITMDAHRILLAQNGIHIIENLDLEELSQCGRADFAFVTLPLRIKGATGSPLRPVALV